MSLVKSTKEFRTILDFSQGKVSKNFIRNSLRTAEILEQIPSQNSNTVSIIDNWIKIGMYQIKLCFDLCLSEQRTRLREYGGFNILLCEIGRNNTIHYINPLKDRRFKNQYWAKLNDNENLRIENLIDVILYVKRLNNLKLFL